MTRRAAYAHSLPSPSDAEIERIREIVRQQTFPPGVATRFKVELAEDNAGQPAVYIDFRVDKDREPTKAYIDRLLKFERAVSAALHAADSSRWPYIRFAARV